MIYLKIFLKTYLLLLLLFLSGCVSENIHTEMNKDSSNNPLDVIESKQNVTEESTSENELPDLNPVLKEEEPVSAAVDFVAWTVPEEDNSDSELPAPEVQIREKETEEKFGFVYSSVTEPVTTPEIIIEKIQTDELTKSGNLNNEVISDEVAPGIIFNETEMNAIVKVERDITLSGRGWIYLSKEGTANIEYLGRHFSNNSTVYTFFPESVGTAILKFQFQDVVKNNHTIKQITLNILPEETISSKETVVSSAETELTVTDVSADLEESLFILLNERDNRGLAELTPDLVGSTLPPIQEKLPEIAEILFKSSYFVQSALILEELVKEKTFNIPIDRFLFLLGKIYEEDSSIRNEHTSAAYYKKLIDDYPASIYWEDSQDRYRYLKRRYIDIR